MSTIKLEIQRVDIKTFGSHFVIAILEQLTFPEKLIDKQQFRTNIETDTEFPVFTKNIFEFNNVILGNRICIKFGLYLTSARDNFDGSLKELLNISKLIGIATFLFTVDFINKLRKHAYVCMDLKFFHPEKLNVETGGLTYKLSYKAVKMDAIIYDDNKEIESVYYDPFEKDKIVIKEKLVEVIKMNEERQFMISEQTNKLDDINALLKKTAFDLNKARIDLDKLDKENDIITKRLVRLQNVDEIHIECDLLAMSQEGIELLKKRYAVLLSQIALQTEYTNAVENEYKQLDFLMSKIRLVKERISLIKDANNEVKFNISREMDLIPLVRKYIEKTKANDEIILSLQNSLEEINKTEPNGIIVTEKKLDDLYKQRKMIEEKKIQMDLHQELFSQDDYKWEENFIKIIGSDLMMNKMFNERERFWIDQFRIKKEELEAIANDLSNQIAKIQKDNDNSLKNRIIIDPGLRKRKVELTQKIDLAEKREKVLMNESDTSVMFYKSTISKLKSKIEEADKIIDREVEFAKRNYYKVNEEDKY